MISESLYALHSVTVSSRPVQVSDGSTTGSSPDRRRAYNSIKDIINGIISYVVNGIGMHEAAVDRLNSGLTGLTGLTEPVASRVPSMHASSDQHPASAGTK